MHKGMRRKFFLDELIIWNITLTDTNKPLQNKFTVRSKMIGYFWDDFVPKAFFDIRTATQVKNFTTITKGQNNTSIRYYSNWLIRKSTGGKLYRVVPTD